MQLERVYPPENDTRTTVADIVAVHGLNPSNRANHGLKTWEKNGRLWLRDDLPESFPDCSVYIYQYESFPSARGQAQRAVNVAENLIQLIDANREGDHDRPLIFVAHSLGGLVVENVLVKAKLRGHPLLNSVVGLVFFSVPHRGGRNGHIQLGQALEKIVNCCGLGWTASRRSEYLDLLAPESASSDSLSDLFLALLNHCRIASFYELDAFGSLGLVVQKSSAVFDLDPSREVQTGLPGHHSDMCRFDTRQRGDRESFLLVKTRIREMLKDGRTWAARGREQGQSSVSGQERGTVAGAPAGEASHKGLLDKDGFQTVQYRKWWERRQPSQLPSPRLQSPRVALGHINGGGEQPYSQAHAPRSRSRSPMPSVPPRGAFGQAPRGSSTYRVSNLELRLSDEDIRAGLKSLEHEGLSRGGNRFQVRSCALATLDRRTAVVTFKQPLRLQSQANHHKLTMFKMSRQLVPEMDAHFGGITPLASPWYDETALNDASEGESRLAWCLKYVPLVSWLFPTASSPGWRSFDIIILTPPGQHPFDFWKTDTDDFGTDAMWVADFLPNEGFDRTRISIFGSDNQDNAGQECLDVVAEYVQKSGQLGPDHSVVLVEFLSNGASAQSVARETYRRYGKGTSKKPRAGLWAIIFTEPGDLPQPRHKSAEPVGFWDYCIELSWSPSPLRFSGNDSSVYRALVDSIWSILRRSYEKKTDRVQTVDNPLQRLEKLTEPLASSEFVNPAAAQRGGTVPLGEDKSFYAIVNDEDFVMWLDPASSVDALRIAGPSGWRLRDLCKSLRASKHAEGYDVLHIDCDNIGHECKKEEGYGKGSTLLGPFLLSIFRFIVSSWAKKCADGGGDALAETVAAHALEDMIRAARAAGADSSVEEPAGEGRDALLQSLVTAMERLGSNLVQVLEHALRVGRETNLSAVRSARLMILLSGLHAFKESPELGRLIHGIRELHRFVAGYGVCKILFTYDERKHLNGLLCTVDGISDAEMRECLSSLDLTKGANTTHADKRHEKTLEWLWEDHAFASWKGRDDSGLLLLFGKPASGKSVLSQFVAEELRDKEPKAVIASYFFHADALDDLRTSTAMLQGLLYHLLSGNRSFFPHFQRRFRQLKERSRQGEEDIAWQEDDLIAVLDGLQCHPFPERLYVLVDGLDESRDPPGCAKALAELLVRVCEGQGDGEGGRLRLCIKLLVATRRDGAAERALTGPLVKRHVVVRQIVLQNKNEPDIREYCRSALAEAGETDDAMAGLLAKRRRRGRAGMLEDIVKKSQGIFLWAKLAIAELINESINSPAELKAFLDQIPPDIQRFYERLLGRLGDRVSSRMDRGSHMRKAGRMFRIVMEARRPLMVDEFRDVFILPSDHDPGSVIMDDFRPEYPAKVIANDSANFLEVDKETGAVSFLHPTASEFFEQKPEILGVWDDKLPIMGAACIWYLQKASMELEKLPKAPSPQYTPVDGMDAFADKMNDYPLLPYAIEHTSDHLSRNQESHVIAMRRLSACMGKSPIRFLLSEWMQRRAEDLGIAAPPRPEHNCESFKNNILHCAASRLRVTAVKVALAAGAAVDSQSMLHKTRENAMCLAIMSSRGSQDVKEMKEVEEVVRALLEHGASPNARTRFQGTPLHYAGKYMQDRVVALLLSHHAGVHDRDAQDMTPLHRTIIGLNQRRPMLEDPDEDGDGDNDEWSLAVPQAGRPRAASGEHPDVQMRANGTLARDVSLDCVKLLLEAGADPKAADRQGQKPIHWAAALRDREDIVKALLDAVADQGSKRRRAADEKCLNKGTTPLHWASGYGNCNVVGLLLREGARADLADNRGKTAINWAARYGHHEILAALLDSVRENARKGGKDLKAVVNMREKRAGRHALTWACQKGHAECARLLIEAGANVNLAEGGDDEVGGTPMSWAITFGHLDVIDLLVEKGATYNEGEGKRPVLGWAAARGRVDIFERLLHAWRANNVLLEPDEADSKGWTPFMLAAAWGHVDMLRYLDKNHRIQRHRLDKEKNTALLLAAGWGRVDAVRWLVEEGGLDINHVNCYQDTALHRAANWGRGKDVIVCLLGMGARSDLVNSKGKTYKDLEREFKRKNELMGLGKNDGGQLHGEDGNY